MNKSVIVLAIFFLTSCRYEIKEKKTTTSSDLMEQKAVEQKSALEKTVPQEQPLPQLSAVFSHSITVVRYSLKIHYPCHHHRAKNLFR
jgi:hypothetical protein